MDARVYIGYKHYRLQTQYICTPKARIYVLCYKRETPSFVTREWSDIIWALITLQTLLWEIGGLSKS